MKDFLGVWTLVIKSLGLVWSYHVFFNHFSSTICLPIKVFFGSIWPMARERRSTCACGVLLCQFFHEAVQ